MNDRSCDSLQAQLEAPGHCGRSQERLVERAAVVAPGASRLFGWAAVLVALGAASLLSNTLITGPATIPGGPEGRPGPVDLTRLPLLFEPQGGHAGKQEYVARTPGVAVRFGADAFQVTLRKPGKAPVLGGNSAAVRVARGTRAGVARTVSFRLVGADPAARLQGEGPPEGRVNRLLGNDPAQWQVGLPTYSRVRAAGVYPGIDVVHYGTGRALEHDFIVAPGGDPGVIVTQVEGADRLAVTPEGELVAETSVGEVRQLKPVAYQQAGSGRQFVAASYRLLDDERLAFELGEYDRTRPLVIDPQLSFSTFVGGSAGDSVQSIATDSEGYVYVAAETGSSDLPATAGSYRSGSDIAIFKLNPTGTAQIYCTYIGGSRDDAPSEIAVGTGTDKSVYITGGSFSTDFPTVAAFQSSNHGEQDAVVLRLKADGSGLIYSTYYGGSGGPLGEGELGSNIVVDGTGNAYVTGWCRSSDFPVSDGAYQTVRQGGSHDVFAAKFGSAGNRIYGTYLGGGDDDLATGIEIDEAGNAYIAAHTVSPEFPPRAPSGSQTTLRGSYDTVLLKLNATGTNLHFYTYYGGGDVDTAYGRMARDSSGNIYVGGWTASTDLTTTMGAYQRFDPDGSRQGDAFVAKFDGNTGVLLAATYLGGSDLDEGRGMGVDPSGNVYLVGRTHSTDFPTRYPVQSGNGGGVFDGFIAKFDPGLTSLQFSTYLGRGGHDDIRDVVADGCRVTVGGITFSTNYPTTVGAYDTTYSGPYDGYVTQIDLGADLALQMTASPDPVYAGATTEFRVTATSLGPCPATGVVLENPLPAGVELVSATGDTGGTPVVTGGKVVWNIGTLDSGADAELRLVLRPGTAGTLVNQATVAGTEPDPEPTNNTAQQSVSVLPAADLSLSIEGSPGTAFVCQPLTYVLTARNEGPSPSQAVAIATNLPAGTTLLSMETSQGSPSVAGSLITGNLGTVAPGSSATMTLRLRPDSAGTVSVSGTVSADTHDPTPGNNGDGESSLALVDSAAPTCHIGTPVTVPGTPPTVYVPITLSDSASGVARVEMTSNSRNVTLVVPGQSGSVLTFDPSVSSVVVKATKLDPRLAARVELRVTDCAGNSILCDPVFTELEIPARARSISRTFSGLPEAEHIVSIQNDRPGVKVLKVAVNGTYVRPLALAAGGRRTLDVRSALKPGEVNEFTLTALGAPGSRVSVMIADSAVGAPIRVRRAPQRSERELVNLEWGP